MTTGEDHQPQRPQWTCRSCGEPWPCEPARRHLVEDTGGGTALAMACWSYFDLYVHDVGDGPLGEVYPRFLGWSREGK